MKKLLVALAVVALVSVLGVSSAFASKPITFPYGGPWCSAAPGGLAFLSPQLNMTGQIVYGRSGMLEDLIIEFKDTSGTLYGPGSSNSCFDFIRGEAVSYGSDVVLGLTGASGKMTMHWNRATGSPETMTVQGKQGDGTRIDFAVANGKISTNSSTR